MDIPIEGVLRCSHAFGAVVGLIPLKFEWTVEAFILSNAALDYCQVYTCNSPSRLTTMSLAY